MNKYNMYLRTIESIMQSLSAYVKKYGFKENLGQPEYSDFRSKVNNCEELDMAQKATLCSILSERINNLE